MPKYRHKMTVQMKQHQIGHMEEGHTAFLDQLDAEHEELIQRIRNEHAEHKERLAEQYRQQKDDLLNDSTFEVKQNTSKEPLEIAVGIIILPGDYYVEDDVVSPFGIAADDLAISYEKV